MYLFSLKAKRRLSIFMIWMMILSVMPISSMNVYAEENGSVIVDVEGSESVIVDTEESEPVIVGDEGIIEQAKDEQTIERQYVEEANEASSNADSEEMIIDDSINEDSITEEALLEGEVDPVSIDWTDTPGQYHVVLNTIPTSLNYTWHLYQGDKVVRNGMMTGTDSMLDWYSDVLHVSEVKESGKLRISIIVDGTEYFSSEWDYTCPDTRIPEITNFNWIYGENGIPTGISFDYSTLFSEGYYSYFISIRDELTRENRNSNIEFDDRQIKDGKVVFSFPESWSEEGFLKENTKYTLNISAETKNITKIVNNDSCTKIYTCSVGEPLGLPVGPQNIDFDSNNYIYEFVSGDSYSSDNTYYRFDVSRNGEWITCFTIEPQKGKKESINFASLLNKSGDYDVKVYSLRKDNPESQFYNGYFVESLEFSYELPLSKLSAPTGVAFKGTTVSCNSVNGANTYVLKLEFDYISNEQVRHYSRVLPDAVKNPSFDISKYISDYDEISNIVISVCAVPNDCNETAISDYAQLHKDKLDVKMLFNGPQNIQMNTKTGELSFVTGGNSNGNDDFFYGFSLKDSSDNFIKYNKYSVTKSGENGKVSFAGLYTQTGTYKIVVSVSKRDENGYYSEDVGEYFFEYDAPTTKISTPADVKLDGTIVSWDSVANAQCYQVKVDYVDSTNTNHEYYIESYTNSADIKIFASDRYRDVFVSVCAVPADATQFLVSDFSSKIEYIYVPEVTNIEWNVDATGKPVSISWDLDENFTEEYFDYVLELSSKFEKFHNFQYPFTEPENTKVENGKVIYTIPDWYHTTAGMITYNDLFNAVITARDLSDHDKVIASGENSYEWGTVRAVPNGPSNVEYDSKTGILTFISGDDYDEALDIGYNVNVIKNNKWIGGESYSLPKKGESVSINLARFFDEDGTYTLNLYAMYKKTVGYTYSYEYEKNIDCSKAEQSLSVPANVRLEDGIAKWDSVANAQGYAVDIVVPGDSDSKYNEYSPVNSIDLSEYINDYDEFTFTVVAVTNDFSKYSNSAKSDSVEYKVPVKIEWNKKSGAAKYIFDTEPNTEGCSARILRNGNVIHIYDRIRIYRNADGLYEFCPAIAYYMTESGTYKAEYIENGKTYSSEEWNYTMPSKKAIPMSNIEWETDDTGKPIAITFDKDENFVEGLFFYSGVLVDASEPSWSKAQNIVIYPENITEVGNDRLRYDISFVDIFENNTKYELYMSERVGDIQVIYSPGILYKRSVYTWGEVEEKYNGPLNVNFNLGTGILEYTEGDVANVNGYDGLRYNFELAYEGNSLHTATSSPSKVGQERKISFTGYVEETGHYTLTVSCLAGVTNDYDSTIAIYEYDYVKPQNKILAPAKVLFDGKKLSWSSVDGAYSYMVKIEYDTESSTGIIKRLNRRFNQMEGKNTFDVASFAKTLNGGNIEVYVAAIPYNITDAAMSDYVQAVPCAFNTVVSEMIIGDPATKQADIHVVNASGAKVAGVTYTSSNTEVATVNANGIVTAVSAGEVTITAQVSGSDEELTMNIEVISGIYRIDFMDTTETTDVFVGDSINEIVTASPSTAQIKEYSVTSSNTDLVNVYFAGMDGNSRITFVTECVANVNADTVVDINVTVVDENDRTFNISKKYKIHPFKQPESLIGVKGHAYVAANKTLSKVRLEKNGEYIETLPGEWKFTNPNQDLTKYNGLEKAQFSVYCETLSGQTRYDYIEVYFHTPNTEFVKELPTVMKAGTESGLFVLGKDEKKGVFGEHILLSSNTKLLEVCEKEGGYVLNAIAKGTVTLTYKVSGVVVATKKITVVSDSLLGEDEIKYEITDLEGNPVSLNDVTIKDEDSSKVFTLKNKIEDTYTMNVTSSDTKVLKIENGSKISGDKKATLKFVDAGYVTLTLTANDEAKTKKTILIHVVDRSSKETVSISNSVITIDTAIKEKNFEEVIRTFNDGERTLKGAKLYEAKYFDKNLNIKAETVEEMEQLSTILARVNGSTGEITFKIQEGIDSNEITAGKYVLGLDFADGNDADTNKTAYLPLTIKKTTSKPKFIFEQDAVYDLSRKDSGFISFVVSDAKDNAASVSAIQGLNPFGVDKGDYMAFDGRLLIFDRKEKTTFDATVESSYYKPVKTKFTLKTISPKYVLSDTSGTYYTDLDDTYPEITINSVIGKQKSHYAISSSSGSTVSVNDDSSYKVGFEAGSKLVVKLKEGATPSASEKLTITYYDDRIGERKFTYTVKALSLSKTKLVPKSKSLTMYNYAGKDAAVSTTIKLTGNVMLEKYLDDDSNYEISEKVNSKLGASLNQTLSATYNPYNAEFTVRKTSSRLKDGTYNFVFTVKTSGNPISVTIPVKVISVDGTSKKNSVTVKTTVKNNVNVLARSAGGIKVTPKFTNVSSDVYYELCGLTGKNADMFSINGNEVYLKSDAKILEKETYSFKVVYEVISNGAVLYVTSEEIKVSFKMPKTELKMSSSSINVLDKSGDKVDLLLYTITNGRSVNVEKIELVNMNESFDFNKVNAGGELQYNPCGKTVAGKTYSLKFNVYLSGAPENSKPLTVSYTVKIAQ